MKRTTERRASFTGTVAAMAARNRIWMAMASVVVLAAGMYFAGRSGTDYKAYSNDFNVYYFASREMLSGRSPYDQRLKPWTPYLYPPLLAELITPLALLPLPVAAYIWWLVNVSATIAAAAIAARLVRSAYSARAANCDSSGPEHADAARWTVQYPMVIAAVSLVVLGRFSLDCFAMGQVNPIVTFLAIAHVYFYARRRRGMSVLTLALASVLKIGPLLFVVYHLLMGRVRYSLLCIALVGSIALVSFALLGNQSMTAMRTFYHQTIQNGQGFDLSYSGNQSLRGAELRLLNEPEPDNRKTTDPLVIAFSAVFLLAAAWRARSRYGSAPTKQDTGVLSPAKDVNAATEPTARSSLTRKSLAAPYEHSDPNGFALEAAAIAPFFCLMVMLSPLGWKNHFVILLLPVAILIGRAARSVGQCVRSAATPGSKSVMAPILRSTLRSLLRSPAAISIFLAFFAFNFTSPAIIGKAWAERADSYSLIFFTTALIYLALIFTES